MKCGNGIMGLTSGGRRWDCSSTASGTMCGTTRRLRRAGSSAAKSQFRNWVTPDGSAGPSGRGGFRAEPNRYHLYVAFACPWAHRTLIMRKLKGLGIADRHLGRQQLHGARRLDVRAGPRNDRRLREPRREALRALHDRGLRRYSGRATVPVLWDKHERTIVSNESAEIVRMLNSAFDRGRRESQRLLSRRSCAPRSTS